MRKFSGVLDVEEQKEMLAFARLLADASAGVIRHYYRAGYTVEVKADGKDQTFAVINAPGGPYHDRDLYVVVYDLSGKCLAHGANPKQIGKDLLELRDPDGKFFVKERVEMAKTQPSFWQDYKFLNPVTRQIEPKSMYLEKVDDMLVGCGVYKPS